MRDRDLDASRVVSIAICGGHGESHGAVTLQLELHRVVEVRPDKTRPDVVVGFEPCQTRSIMCWLDGPVMSSWRRAPRTFGRVRQARTVIIPNVEAERRPVAGRPVV